MGGYDIINWDFIFSWKSPESMENIPQLLFTSLCIYQAITQRSSAFLRPWHSLWRAEQDYSLMKLLRFSSTCLTDPCSFVPHQLGPNLWTGGLDSPLGGLLAVLQHLKRCFTLLTCISNNLFIVRELFTWMSNGWPSVHREKKWESSLTVLQ